MKHNIKISLIIVGLFLIAQFIGLSIVNAYFTQELPFGIEKPQIQEEISYIPLMIAMILATGFALILIKFEAQKIWKIWLGYR